PAPRPAEAAGLGAGGAGGFGVLRGAPGAVRRALLGVGHRRQSVAPLRLDGARARRGAGTPALARAAPVRALPGLEGIHPAPSAGAARAAQAARGAHAWPEGGPAAPGPGRGRDPLPRL